MDTKKLLVSFVAIATVLLLASTVSAKAPLAYEDEGWAKVDGVLVSLDGNFVDSAGATLTDLAVEAGETITVKVHFKSQVDASDVKLKAEIEGDKIDISSISEPFDVEEDVRYTKTLTLKVPYELKDELSDALELTLKLYNKDFENEGSNYLNVQRPSYNADIKSISASQTVEAGESFPVEIVLTNIGYNELEDTYVTVRVPALGLEKSNYLGDIVALECDDDDEEGCDEDDEDTVSGKLFLKVPYDSKSGVYTLEVEVSNDDMTTTEVRQIAVNNDFSEGNTVVSSTSKTVATGESAKYNLVIVNPTDKVKVYRVVTESSGDLSASAEDAVVAVPAGSSKTVTVIASADTEGEYNFDVSVFSGETVVDSVTLTAKVEGSSIGTGSPVVVLTVILAIIFIVLLIVLIVLIGKKPEKSEEFGESYY